MAALKIMSLNLNFFARHKHAFLYGISLAVVLFLLTWLKVRLIILDHAFEVYIGTVAFIFTALGIWLGLKLTKPKKETVIVKEEVYVGNTDGFIMNEGALKELNLSNRELEVLQLMAKGLSNQEIAARLFLSLSTIKSHGNNLFEKLDVRRRTQAVDKARKLGIIP
jgi:two-component system, NarL family, response regulator LiaR